jgi:hypothetical protein
MDDLDDNEDLSCDECGGDGVDCDECGGSGYRVDHAARGGGLGSYTRNASPTVGGEEE